jgi:acyl carrier protein phosphodiesterase
MNYLAHLYLSDDSPGLLVGAMLGDFVGGDYRRVYSREVCAGIELHREIDRFTDSHAVVRASKRRIGSEYRLLKAVMVDVFYDHFLAKNWNAYSSTPLEDFCLGAYEVLESFKEDLPVRLRELVPRMIRDNWLVSYREVDSIALVMNGLSRRMKRENNLSGSHEELIRLYVQLERDFGLFFPQLEQQVTISKQRIRFPFA